MSRQYERILTPVLHYLTTAERIFAGLDLGGEDQQRIQLCSNAAGVPIAVIEVGGVVLCFSMTEGWRPIEVWLPPAVLTRAMFRNGYNDGMHMLHGRKSGILPRADNPASREHEARFMWPSCPHWGGYGGFRMGIGKMWVRDMLPVSYEPFEDMAVLDTKHKATSGPVRADRLPTLAAEVTPRVEAVCPEGELLFHTLQIEDECVYLFDLFCDGELVAEGFINSELTR